MLPLLSVDAVADSGEKEETKNVPSQFYPDACMD
jgi:hypothetical protein